MSCPGLKAMRAPSGDHVGRPAQPAVSNRRSPVPSALMSEIESGVSYAICEPSGDHAGLNANPDVSRRAPVPEARRIQISFAVTAAIDRSEEHTSELQS